MAKKPILTDDPFAGEGPVPPAPPVASAPVGATRPVQAPAAEPTRPMGAPEAGRDAAGHARPKTRIHGFTPAPEGEAAPPTVGWLVVVAGPGRGASRALTFGMNGIGRGDGVQVLLDFGDDAISREAHAYVTYDDEARAFHVSHGGKANLVRLNDAPVLAAEPLTHGDTLRIGATSLRFVALCGPDFDWSDP